MRDIRAILYFAVAFTFALIVVALAGFSLTVENDYFPDIVIVVQAIITVVAVLVSGLVTGRNLVLFRRTEPNVSVLSTVVHRNLNPPNVHLRITTMLHNTSRVQLVFETGVIGLHQLLLVSNHDYEYVPVYGRILREDQTGFSPRIDVGALPLDWSTQTLIVEPRETRQITFEFMIDGNIESVRVRVCLHNRWHQHSPGSVSGWESVNFYDIK